MPEIRILSEHISNLIAAGEVVERPSSVVKELIENAIDAGADQIEVEIQNGGKELIRVTDNGKGMSRDDLELCIQRFATSKIRNENDLHSISTMGFRGEALPSISSVSRFSIISRTPDSEFGYLLEKHGNDPQSVSKTSAKPGATVVVSDLFYNTPARLKFLKSKRTETSLVLELVEKYAISLPEISFKLISEGKSILVFPKGMPQKERISLVLSTSSTENNVDLVEFSGAFEGIRCLGYYLPIRYSSSNSRKIHLFVNNRPVKDKLLIQAVISTFRTRLTSGEYPVLVLFLTVPMDTLDVNVHPAKNEVRFSESGKIFGIIKSAIDSSFNDAAPGIRSSFSSDNRPAWSPQQPRSPMRTNNRIHAPMPEIEEKQETLFVSAPSEFKTPENSFDKKTARPDILGVIGNTYILCKHEDVLYIIDQHAVHEKIIFEKLSARENKAHQLMIPADINLSASEMALLDNLSSSMKDLGFVIESFGPSTVRITEVPAALGSFSRVRDLIEDIISDKDVPTSTGLLRDRIASRACRLAVKGGDRLSTDEIFALFDQIEEAIEPGFCPHGRPAILALNAFELEKLFKRRI